MAKNLNVNLNFTADTSNVENNLNKLKQSLNQISATPIGVDGVDKQLNQATIAAKQLQTHLNNAFNTKTGNLDLTKLQASLSSSGQSLSQLSVKLLGAGKDGQQAFLQMQSAIQSANVQINKSTGFLNEMGTVMKNTVRWQLSSSLLHGFMSGIQEAKGYVEDLNKSLTDIQIVTGQSTDDMARFAEQANKSAKALSTTTIAYTNAALIYYQQGLGDEEVKARTDTTMKMSNVTGESAEKVSSYMTSIWNNFAQGSDNLELFADKITALGAATASSSEEIAEGLEKFAAVGDTVGLSYDYATTALATVIDQTRQSPEVVGTAFKTLFARIQDLELGDTLDDGTTLGTYSQSLEKVGINIKDTSGQLKDMDQILDEMGSKWTSLSKDQQVALAQNVAGTRQYTQLVALMDNWDKFKENLVVAQDAEGTLQKQADIYAESWEGARKRVKASAQAIYSDLIDDKAFIKGTNALADFLDGIDKVIDRFGGLKNIVIALGALLTKVFQQDIVKGINAASTQVHYFGQAIKENVSNGNQIRKTTGGLKGFFKGSESVFKTNLFESSKELQQREILEQSKQARETALVQKKKYGLSKDFELELETQQRIAEVEETINAAGDKISLGTRERLKNETEILKILGEQQIENAKKLESQKKANEELRKSSEIASNELLNSSSLSISGARTKIGENKRGTGIFSVSGFKNETISNEAANLINSIYRSEKIGGKVNVATGVNSNVELVASQKTQQEMIVELTELETKRLRIMEMLNQVDNPELTNEETAALKKKINVEMKEYTIQEQQLGLTEEINSVARDTVGKQQQLAKSGSKIQIGSKVLTGFGNKINEAATPEAKLSAGLEQGQKYREKDEELQVKADLEKGVLLSKTAIEKNAIPKEMGSYFSEIMQGATQAAMGISMLQQAVETFNNEDLSGFDKFTSIIMNLGFAIPSLVSSMRSGGELIKNLSSIKQLSKGGSIFEGLNMALKGDKTLEYSTNVAQNVLNLNELLGENVTIEQKREIAKKLSSMATEGETSVLNKETAELMKNNEQQAIAVALKLKYVAIAAAVVATVVTLGVTIYKYAQKYNEALEESTKIAQDAKEIAESSQQDYENLLTTVSDYKEAKESLKELTKGTAEWQEKVVELNNQVIGLMNNYSGLSAYVTSQDGLLNISDEGLDYVQETQLRRAKMAQAVYTNKQIKQIEAENNVVLSNFAKELGNSSLALVAGKEISEAKKIIETYSKDPLEAKSLISELNSNIDFTELEDALGEAAETVSKNTLAVDSLTQQYNSSLLEDKDWYKESPYKDAYSISYGEFKGKDSQTVGTTMAEKYDRYNAEGVAKMFKDYAEILQINYQEGSFKSTREGYKYTDSSGEVKNITFSQIYDTVAADIKAELYESTGAKGKTDTTLSKLKEKIQENLIGVTADEIEQLTTDTYKAKKGKADQIDFDSYSGEMIDQIRNLKVEKGTGLSELQKAANNYFKNLADITDEIDVDVWASEEEKKAALKKYGAEGSKIGTGYLSSNATKDEETLKQAYQGAWNDAIAHLAETEGMSQTAVLKIMADYEDKTELLKIDKETGTITYDSDRLQKVFDNRKRAQLNIEIKSSAESAATAANLDSNDVEAYAQQLSSMSKYAKYSADALTELAVQQLRYEKAVSSSKDNLSDWRKELEKTDKDALLSTETYQGLQEAYGNLLNIDGTILDDSFIRSTDNAKLLEKAIRGDEDAYNELAEKATASIELKYGLSEDTKFQSQVDSLKDYISNNLSDYDVGVNINDANFLSQLTTMANYLYKLGMNAEQVGDFITSSLGIDAEITEDTGTKTKKILAYNLIPSQEKGVDIKASLFGQEISVADIPQIKYDTSPVYGEVDGGTATALKVTNAHKSAGGDIKKIFKGGKALGSSSSSGKGGSGKGSGSSGSKKSTKNFKDDFRSEKERYHTINRQIDSATKAYDKLSEAKDKAYGADRLAIMDEEKENLKEQIELDKKKIKEAEKYRKQDKKDLKKAASRAGTKIEFNADGSIANYEEMMDKAEAQVKKAYKTHNDDKIEAAEKKYSSLAEAVDKYEESLDTATQAQDDLDESIQSIAEIELEQITYKVEVKLNINDRELKLLQRKIDQWERTKGSGYYDSSYIDKQLNVMSKQQEAYDINKQGIRDILANKRLGDDEDSSKLSESQVEAIMSGTASESLLEDIGLTDEEISQINTYADNMLEAADNIAAAQDEIYEIFEKNTEIYKDNFDKQMSIVEHQKNVVSSLQEIFSLTDQGNTQLLNKMRQAVIDASTTQGLAYRQNMENAQAQLKFFNDQLVDATGAEKVMLEENIQTWEEYYRENKENMLSSLQEALNGVKDKLEANIEEIKKQYEKALSGGYGSFAGLELSMEMSDDIRDDYVAPYEKVYQLSKLTRNIENSIDSTESIKGKQKLLTLQKKINSALEDNVELTEYDLNRMQAEYDLELAKIALEDAQNNKKTVRMQRDNYGNWSYVYTADSDAVDEALQKYEDSIYALRKLDAERDKELEKTIVDLNTKYFEKLQQIMEMEDGTAKDSLMAQLQDWYKTQLNVTLNYANDVVENEKKMYIEEADSYELNTGRKIDSLGEWVTTIEKSSVLMKSGYTSMDEALNGYQETVDKFTEQVVNEYNKSQNEMNDLMKQFDLDTKSATDSVDDLNSQLQITVDRVKELGEELSKITQDDLKKLDAVKEYDSTISSADDEVTNITTSVTKAQVSNIGKAATGAYTGDWSGNQGKLMFLHQKELILNKDETKAFFNLASTLEKIKLPSLFNPEIKPIVLEDQDSKKDTLEQKVEIKAEFPNVTQHDEIELAINNLINRATQYANKR